MTKILSIIGSPRKKGNTTFLINNLNSLLPADSKKTIFASAYKVGPCIDCRSCKKDDLNCIVQDDMQDIYKDLEKSDILVFGTPIYWFAPSAQLKLIIDRLRPYYGNQRLKGKKGILIMAAGSGKGDCETTHEMFKRMFSALGIEFIGSISSHSYDIGDAEKDIDAMEEMVLLAEKVNSL